MSFFENQRSWLYRVLSVRWKQIAATLLGISFIIVLHEFGHWSFCTLFGVGTPHFSIGIGPTIFEKRIGKTVFSLSLLPLGGYTSILGRHETVPLYPQASFNTKPIYQQLLIILGGVIFNLLFALLVVLYFRFRKKRRHPISIPSGAEQLKQKIIGPLGVLKLIADKSAQGPAAFFSLLAWLSFNIALFNLIPLPLLDGGQVLIIVFEKIIQHPLHEKISMFISLTSLTIIGLLLLYTLVQDLRHFSKKDIS